MVHSGLIFMKILGLNSEYIKDVWVSSCSSSLSKRDIGPFSEQMYCAIL